MWAGPRNSLSSSGIVEVHLTNMEAVHLPCGWRGVDPGGGVVVVVLEEGGCD